MEIALDDLDSTISYIAKEDLHAAQGVAQRIWRSAQSLVDNPKIGRVGRVSGVREKVVTELPYLLIYRIKNNDIEIIRLLHDRQSWLDLEAKPTNLTD